MLLILIIGCSKAPPQFDKAYINMSQQDLENAYPDLQQLQETKNEKDETMLVFERSGDDNIQIAQYYIKADKLVGIVVLFSKKTKFDSIANGIVETNGMPSKQLNLMGSQAAIWEHGKNYISLMTGSGPTKIELPTGQTKIVNPKEIILILGKK